MENSAANNSIKVRRQEIAIIDLRFKFCDILDDLQRHLNSPGVNIHSLDWIMEYFKLFKPINKLHDNPSLGNTGDLLSYYMKMVTVHSSFFSYEMLTKIYNSLEYDEGKRNLEEYEKDFTNCMRQKIAPFSSTKDSVPDNQI